MTTSIKISSSKSVNDWHMLKAQIDGDFNNSLLWAEAIQLFRNRLNTRYMDHVSLLKKQRDFTGEGFAVMTILCVLIEFLESTVQGKSYRYCKDKELKKFEYNKSADLFISFLSKRKPFLLGEQLAYDFYKNVRCPLLHEARTTSNWVIRVDSSKLIELKNGMTIVNRNIFSKKIDQFIELYTRKLRIDTELKYAFIRKFDSLCN